MLAKQTLALVWQKLLYGRPFLRLKYLPLMLLGLTACDKEKEAVEPVALPPTPEELLSKGPYYLTNPYLIEVIAGKGELIPATGDILQDPEAALEQLKAYADEDAHIDTQAAIDLFNHPDLIAKTSFYLEGWGTVADPSLNMGLRMIAALAASYRGGEMVREYLLSKTAAGLPVVIGIAYSDNLPEGATAAVPVNPETGQALILFAKEHMYESPFLLLPVFFHELLGHQNLETSINEERAANTLEHIVMYHQVLEHPELYKHARNNRLSHYQMGQLAQHIAFLNSLQGEDTLKGPYLHITEANSRVFPNADDTYEIGHVSNFMEEVDLAQGFGLWKEEGLRYQNSEGWRLAAICGHALTKKQPAKSNSRTMPEGGNSMTNRYFEEFIQNVFGINAGGINLYFSDIKTKKLADELYEASRQPSWFDAANRLKVMEVIGLEAPPETNPLP